jgi:ABC-type sugar transport system ATPase subunit
VATLELRGLTKRYGAVEAVRGIDLDVRSGEFLALLGPSGCGKTSTLRMAAGLEPITDGEVRIDGRRVNELPPRRRDVAMVFEDYALYPHMTVFDNIAFPLRVRGVAPADVRARVESTAELLGLTRLLRVGVRRLSGGQQQRVSVGRAIVRRPRVLLMDEPISHLDGPLKAHLRTELKRLHAELGTTTLYVTHDQVEAMALADRIAVMRDGRIEQCAAPAEVYGRPATLFVAGFVGEPPMNVFEGGSRLAPRPPDAIAGVRPADLLVAGGPGPATPCPAECFVVEPRGDLNVVTLRLDGTLAQAETSAAFAPEVGAPLWVGVRPGGLHLFDRASGRRVHGAAA